MHSKHALLVALLLANIAFAGEAPTWEFKHEPVSGTYGIYGGGLADPVAPSKSDAKIAFAVEGKVAKQMFDAMGPDIKDVCTEGTGDRVREKDKGNVSCIRTRNGKYYCNFGFDLRTGKSIGGVVC